MTIEEIQKRKQLFLDAVDELLKTLTTELAEMESQRAEIAREKKLIQAKEDTFTQKEQAINEQQKVIDQEKIIDRERKESLDAREKELTLKGQRLQQLLSQ